MPASSGPHDHQQQPVTTGDDEATNAQAETELQANVRSAQRIRRRVAVAGLLLSGLLLAASWGLDIGTSARPGPGLMPRLAAAGFALAAILALIVQVTRSDDLEAAPDKAGLRRQGVIFLTLTAYVILLPIFGFLLSSALALSVTSWRISPTGKIRRAVVTGVVTAVAVDLAFRLLLGVNLPSGVWGVRTA